MDVSYNKLFKLLIDKEMKKTEFAKEVGISANTLAKLSRNETVSMDVIIRICRALECSVDEIMDILPETRLEDKEESDGQHISIHRFSDQRAISVLRNENNGKTHG